MENSKLTIACFWWGEWGAPYGAEYVMKLRNMFHRYLTIPHRFVCFSDRGEGKTWEPAVEFKQLPHNLSKWSVNLPKFWVYSKDSGLSGRVVLVDLDSVIVGSMDEMMSYKGPWCGIKPMRPGKTHIGGGLVSFEHKEYTWLWDVVSKDAQALGVKYNGRERLVYEKYINSPDRWQDLYPGQLLGYKKFVKRNGNQLPEGARFIAFHGNPRPHQVRDHKWMKEYWV